MPVKASASKALRQSDKRAARNRARKRSVKHVTKTSLTAIDNKDADAVKQVQQAYQVIDKAAKTGAMHKNTAARKKSQLMRKLHPSKKSGKAKTA